MPMIFHNAATGWATLPISTPRGLLRLAPVVYEPEPISGTASDSLFLVRIEPERGWAVLVPNGMRVNHNGQPMPAGLRILAHRDSLAVPGADPVFFSTEETARVEAFAGSKKVTCPRCRTDIVPGQSAVKCPGCGVFHHETKERPCWTYAPVCAVCPQPTALDIGLQWTPEAL